MPTTVSVIECSQKEISYLISINPMLSTRVSTSEASEGGGGDDGGGLVLAEHEQGEVPQTHGTGLRVSRM